jgi:hypothetical protein
MLSLAGPHCNNCTVTFTLHSSCHTHTNIRTPLKQVRHLATRIDRKSLSNTAKFETIHLRERWGRHFIRYPFFSIYSKLIYSTTRVEDTQLHSITSDSVSLTLHLFIVYIFLYYIQFSLSFFIPVLCHITFLYLSQRVTFGNIHFWRNKHILFFLHFDRFYLHSAKWGNTLKHNRLAYTFQRRWFLYSNSHNRYFE